MKIYSWNVYFQNRRFDDAFVFIEQSNFDVFCLQEVPEEFLERLQTLPVELVSALDTEFVYETNGKVVTLYNVVLSVHPITSQDPFLIQEIKGSVPFRGRVFRQFLMLIGAWWRIRIEKRGSLSVDIKVPGLGLLRVMCAHFSSTNSTVRSANLKTVLEKVAPFATVICGDLNILESFYTTCSNWFTGGSFKDSVFFKRERDRFERKLAELGFSNPFRGKITHPSTRSQLDHILIPKEFVVTNAQLEARHGSDHNPIFVELESQTPLVLTHRGGNGKESTPETVRKALAAKADIIELDVRKSRDGVLYCHHGSIPWGMIAATFFGLLTFKQIQKLVGKRHTLDSLLELIPSSTCVYLDIKDFWITKKDLREFEEKTNITVMRSDGRYGSRWLNPLVANGEVVLLDA